MAIKSLIKSPVQPVINSLLGASKINKPLRWIVSSNSFVIADSNGRIITAGK